MKKSDKKEAKAQLKITKLESKVTPLCPSRSNLPITRGGCLEGALGLVADY